MLSTQTPTSIRLIEARDLPATLAIYRSYVENTAISFEYEVPSLVEWQSRVSTITQHLPWLICECDGEMIGYAYACKHRERAAYQWSVDSAVYIAETYHRKGIARQLYTTLFRILKLQGYVNVFAGVTMPNEKSEDFHLSMGFKEIATYKNVGYKAGAWHDTKWFQLSIGEHDRPPGKILNISDLTNINSVLSSHAM